MENMSQKLVLMNSDGEKIGTASREECHIGAGKMHWGFILLIKNSNNQYILARRSENKSCGANLWDASVVSHVLPGEALINASVRRSKEELEINVKKIKDIGAFVYTASYGKYSENEYCSVLVGKSDEMPDPNPEEISEIRMVTLDQLVNDIKRDKSVYTPWLTIPVEKFRGIL